MQIVIELKNGLIHRTPITNCKDVEVIVIDHDAEEPEMTTYEADNVGIKGLRQYCWEAVMKEDNPFEDNDILNPEN